MLNEFLKSKIAIVGGGNFCRNLLQLLFNADFDADRPTILGVADFNSEAEGMLLARQLGILTLPITTAFFRSRTLDVLMELTPDFGLAGLAPANTAARRSKVARSYSSGIPLELPASGSSQAPP